MLLVNRSETTENTRAGWKPALREPVAFIIRFTGAAFSRRWLARDDRPRLRASLLTLFTFHPCLLTLLTSHHPMRYVETPPDPRSPLAPYVRCFWSLEGSGEVAAETIPPDGAVELIFHFGDRFEQMVGERLVMQPLSLFVAELRRPVVVS